jgi:hypothetical protein
MTQDTAVYNSFSQSLIKYPTQSQNIKLCA